MKANTNQQIKIYNTISVLFNSWMQGRGVSLLVGTQSPLWEELVPSVLPQFK